MEISIKYAKAGSPTPNEINPPSPPFDKGGLGGFGGRRFEKDPHDFISESDGHFHFSSHQWEGTEFFFRLVYAIHEQP
jgi:hypothetical protein